MQQTHRPSIAARLLLLCIICAVAIGSMPLPARADSRVGVVDVDYTLNVRSGPGTSYSRIGSLTNGTIVDILNEVIGTDGAAWYQINYTSGGTSLTGYIHSEYVRVTTIGTNQDFENYMTQQGFPDSYKSGLRVLHSLYPNWVFVAVHTNLDWNNVVAAESVVGRNLVPYNSPASWINTSDVDSSGRQIPRDGSYWVAASSGITAYYLDPRNFLSDPYIFQFESLSYSNGVHTIDGVQKILNGTFMSSTYSLNGVPTSYAQTFMDAARQSNVSPYHLAARVRMEQGTGGTTLTSGTVPGYAGYYNFFNVGAATTSTASAVVNGAIYAMGSNATYLRPWTDPYKAIVGGSIYLGTGYINKGQDTLYFEKFNVVNSAAGLYGHQYMTSVQAPSSESSTMKKAYTADVLNSALVFKIPVYRNMPASPVSLPTGSGGGTVVPPPVLDPNDPVTPPTTNVTVTSATYSIANSQVTGVTEQTSVNSFLSKVNVSGGVPNVTDAYGVTRNDGAVCTGDKLQVLNSSYEVAGTYTIVIYGDINGDGAISAVDLLRVQKHLLGISPMTGAALTACDVNHDGQVNSIDLLRVQKHLLGIASITQ